MIKRIAALLLVFVMALSLAACTTPAGSEATTAPAATATAGSTATPDAGAAATEEPVAEPTIFEKVMAGDPVTVSVLPSSTNSESGVVDTPIGDWLLSKYNLKMDVWSYSPERYTTVLASGDLPDILYISKLEDLENAIMSKLIMQLDDYLPLLPHVAGDEEIMAAFNYIRKYRSAETGNVYAMPIEVGGSAGASPVHVSRYRVFVWWDYFYGVYGQSGAPEVNTIFDLIPLMKTMMEAYPTTADGTKVYGTALYYGQSKTYEYTTINLYNLLGYVTDNLPYMVETDGWNVTHKSILEDDSLYHDIMRWFNQAYREGVLDPDSINYDRNTVKSREKDEQGYYTMGFPGTNPTDVDQWQTLGTNFNKAYYTQYKTYGSTSSWITVSAKTENLDGVLVLLDSFANVDDILVYRDGPDGERWYTDENGDGRYTDMYLNCYVNGADDTWQNGKVYTKLSLSYIKSHYNWTSLGDGQSLIADIGKWVLAAEVGRSARAEQWSDMYGYTWTQDMFRDKGQVIFSSAYDDTLSFCTAPDDIQQLIIDSCASIIVEYTWKMIYATSDEEMEGYWNQMVTECMGLGAQEIIDWRIADLESAAQLKADLAA